MSTDTVLQPAQCTIPLPHPTHSPTLEQARRVGISCAQRWSAEPHALTLPPSLPPSHALALSPFLSIPAATLDGSPARPSPRLPRHLPPRPSLRKPSHVVPLRLACAPQSGALGLQTAALPPHPHSPDRQLHPLQLSAPALVVMAAEMLAPRAWVQLPSHPHVKAGRKTPASHLVRSTQAQCPRYRYRLPPPS